MSVYVGKCKECGRILATAIDDPLAADDVANMVRAGYVIERADGPITIGGVCEHVKAIPDKTVGT